MALSPQVVELVIQTIKMLPKGARVASLGYPDILLPLEFIEREFGLTGLEPHPDSTNITKFHGRGEFVVPTGESFFKSLGAELSVLDIKAWRGDEIIVDLNHPIDLAKIEPFDLLIDNGTTEHCFNVPQAMVNYLYLVKPEGYIIHWNPSNMMNHGFYNFSPTFFWDWYEHNGCTVEHQSLWNFEKEKGEVGYDVPSTKRFNFTSYNCSLLTLVKRGKILFNGVYPNQAKYRKLGIEETK